jgi:hypothetical protein
LSFPPFFEKNSLGVGLKNRKTGFAYQSEKTTITPKIRMSLEKALHFPPLPPF